jgi:hypothetical protein
MDLTSGDGAGRPLCQGPGRGGAVCRRRDLLGELSVVFMDTTTLYLEGPAATRSAIFLPNTTIGIYSARTVNLHPEEPPR